MLRGITTVDSERAEGWVRTVSGTPPVHEAVFDWTVAEMRRLSMRLDLNTEASGGGSPLRCGRGLMLAALLAGLLAGSAEGWPADLLTAHAWSSVRKNYTSTQCTPLDRFDEDLEPECLDTQASGADKLTYAPNATCGGIALYKGRCVVSKQGNFSDVAPEEVEPVLATRLQRSEAPSSMPWCTSFSQAADGSFVGSGITESRLVTMNEHKDPHPYVHTHVECYTPFALVCVNPGPLHAGRPTERAQVCALL